MTEVPDTSAEHEQLEPGTRVEVRDRFTGSWASGFVVEEVSDPGYRLRRQSDKRVLPTRFPPDQVRRERRSMWWV